MERLHCGPTAPRFAEYDKSRPLSCDRSQRVRHSEFTISRVLSWTIIYLGCSLPNTSSDLPGKSASSLILPLFGLAAGGVYQADQSPGLWCALTAPFHPYPALAGRFVFCGTFLRVAPTGRYPAPCSMQLGLSSDNAFRTVARDRLANSYVGL